MFEIILPGIEHIVVTKGQINRHNSAGEEGAQRGQGHLAVKRRVDAALRTEAGKLGADNVQFLRAGDHVAVGRRVVGDSGIHIEAIDRRFGLAAHFSRVSLPLAATIVVVISTAQASCRPGRHSHDSDLL